MATRTISVAGGNWDDTGTWDEATVPVAGDAVVARGGGDSGNVTINVPSACASIILTNYVGTLTFNATLTVTSTVTFVSGMTIAGTSDLICTVTATLTSGGKVLSGGLQLGGTSQTFTLGDDWSVTGVLNFNGTTGTVLTGTAKIITVAGGLTVGVPVTTATSPGIIMTGGSWTGAGILRINLTLAGGITFLAGTLYYDTKTLTYSSGTITVTGNTISCAAATTFATAGLTLNNFTLTTASAITIGNPFNVAGLLLLSGGGGTITINGSAMNLGALTISGSGSIYNFNASIIIAGALTVSATSTWGGTFSMQAASCTISAAVNIILNGGNVTITGTTTVSGNLSLTTASAKTWSTAGLSHSTYSVSGATGLIVLTGGTWSGTGTVTINITLAGDVTISSGTRTCGSLTYTSGSITLAGVTLSVSASATLNTNPLVWENIILTAALTLTINSLLSVSGTLTLPNGAVIFAGTAGFTVGTLTNTTITATRIFTFANGITYTIRVAFTTVHAAAQTVRFTLTSDHASIKAIIILGPSATQDIGFVDPTRINSSAGQQIFSYKGTITNCLNWISAYPVNIALNDPQLCIGI